MAGKVFMMHVIGGAPGCNWIMTCISQSTQVKHWWATCPLRIVKTCPRSATALNSPVEETGLTWMKIGTGVVRSLLLWGHPAYFDSAVMLLSIWF